MAFVLVAAGAEAHAQSPSVGPYHFLDERCFASTATLSAIPGFEFGRFAPPFGPTTIEEAVVGFTPSTSLLNLGNPCGTVPCGPTCPPPESFEYLDLGFDADRRPQEGPGFDLVVFDARFSADDYHVAVRPVGGAFTAPRAYPAAGQVDTGVAGPPPSTGLWAIEVDLADFGLGPGTKIETVRILGSCTLDPFVEYDPAMAASVVRSCTSAASCDDGDPCSSETCFDERCAYDVVPAGAACGDGVCDGAGACVECLDDTHCEAPTPVCDVANATCVACLDDDDCAPPADACLVARCQARVCDATPEPAGTSCASGVCDGDPDDPKCVECLQSADCPSERPLCDTLNTSCRECLRSQDCAPAGPCREVACDLFGACATTSIPGCGADAGVEDGGPSTARDASVPRDAGGGTSELISDGCGCSTPATKSPSNAIALLGVAFLFGARRRSSADLPNSSERNSENRTPSSDFGETVGREPNT